MSIAQTFTVTVAGGKYYIDGVQQATVMMVQVLLINLINQIILILITHLDFQATVETQLHILLV